MNSSCLFLYRKKIQKCEHGKLAIWPIIGWFTLFGATTSRAFETNTSRKVASYGRKLGSQEVLGFN